VVDRSLESSLESLAADRGITICFADLDGADGLWLPEERTILLARGLSDKQAADVLEHELSHVDIEDGHAALDAAMHRHVGKARWAVAGTAAASLALMLGIRVHLDSRPTADSHPITPVAVAPSHTSGGAKLTSTVAPPTRVIMIDGRVRTQTVTVTPPAPSSTAAGTPASTRAVVDHTPTSTPKSGGVAPVTTTSQPSGAGGGVVETTTTTSPTAPPIDTGTATPTGLGPTGAAISAAHQR
jgi:hypothetical protein